MTSIIRIDHPLAHQVPEFMKIIDDLTVGNNVFLVGSAGTLKTTLSETLAYVMKGRRENDGKLPPFKVINCNQWTSPIDIKGGQTMEGYKEGEIHVLLDTALQVRRLYPIDEQFKMKQIVEHIPVVLPRTEDSDIQLKRD